MMTFSPSEGTSSLIGVAICITGNTCISAALNIQKLAHTRLSAEASKAEEGKLSRKRSRSSSIGRGGTERTPLLPTSPSSLRRPALHSSVSDPLLHQVNGDGGTRDHTVVNINDLGVNGNGIGSGTGSIKRRRRTTLGKERREKTPRVDKEFLRSKLWWAGLALLNLGELGNFMAYGFTQASLIAPLGTVALVANCILAPLILKEPFRKQDLLGCTLSILGSITVVYASNSSDKKLSPDEVLEAIKTVGFGIYSIVCLVGIVVLGVLSRGRIGDRFVMIDLGICAIAGGFTVLSTKCISSFLNLLFVSMFRYWITYPILVVLIGTALIQVNFINKALQRFDSRIVIPAQFVSFSSSAIIGSAVLFREFDDVDTASFLNFLFGCGMSALGVYLLTRQGEVSKGTGTGTEENEVATAAVGLGTVREGTGTTPRVQITPVDRNNGSSIGIGFASSSSSAGNNGGAGHLILPEGRTGGGGGIVTGSIRARTLSVTLGGSQYLMLAHSPGGHHLVGGGGRDLEIDLETEDEEEEEEEGEDGVSEGEREVGEELVGEQRQNGAR